MDAMVLGGRHDELIKPRWWPGAAAPDQGDESGKANHTRSSEGTAEGNGSPRRRCRTATGPRNAAVNGRAAKC